MTKQTNVQGDVVDNGPYGPYIQGEIPVNPFNDSNEVVAGTGEGYVGDGTAGWQYQESTGGFWPNHEEWWSERQSEPE